MSFAGVSFLITLVPLASTALRASTLYWNKGGDGNWSSGPADANWNTVPGAVSGNVTWPDAMDDIAAFQDGPGASVTVNGSVQTHGIVQSGSDHAITSGNITLTRDSILASPFIDVQTGHLTIGSVLEGASGMIKSGAGALTLSGDNTYGGLTRVSAGTLTLAGSLAGASIEIAGGASFLNLSGGLSFPADIINSGSMTVNADDLVSTYQQHAGGLLAGTAELTVRGGALLHGGEVSGSLVGNILTDGEVRISGKVSGGSLSVLTGHLELDGVSDNLALAVSSGATLRNTHGGFHKLSSLYNSGTVTLGADDYIRIYVSNGGTLTAGSGVLSAANVLLNDRTVIAGGLTASRLTSSGKVSNRGELMVQSLEITSGTLINTGELGDASSRMTIHSGATLVAKGNERFSSLATYGDGAGTWRGDLTNASAVAPGDNSGFGTLIVDGDFRQTRTGLLQIDLSGSGNDLIQVTGKATFDGTLTLHQAGTESLKPFVAIPVVDAVSYSGNFTTLSEDLDGSVWFNPGNGAVMRVSSSLDMNAPFPGSSGNQLSTWTALYDDVVDPGSNNITHDAGGNSGLWIGSGIADASNPDLMWALAESFTPNGLNPDLLNRLSPEIYASFNDYAVQATRSHLRAALDAPTLQGIADPIGNWEIFTAAGYFDASTDDSPHQADYSLTSSGILTGARTRLGGNTFIAGYAAFDAGSIDGGLIDADQTGWSLGVFSRSVLHEPSRTILTAAIAHGRYQFDGTRESVIADAGGWRPGDVDFSNVDGFSTEFFLGIESQLKPHERIRLIPSAGFRAAFATMDGFTESTGSAAGSPIALTVERDHQDYMIAECGLTAETDINDRLVGWAHLGCSAGIGEDTHVLQAGFANGSRPMRATSDGLPDDLIRLGLGADYRMSDAVAIRFGYHAALGDGESTLQGFNISTSFRF